MRKHVYKLIVITACLFFSACRKDKGLSNYGNYPNNIGKIMVNRCATAGCHNDLSYEANAGLNLSTWENLFKGSTSGSPVIPFRSDFSSLCYFINSYPGLGPVNYPTMPYNDKALTQQEVQAIKDWIDQGAPDVNGVVKWSDNPHRQKAYLANQGCDVVTVFDAETQLPMRYITVGNNPLVIEVPHMIRLSPDGQFWYVVFVGNNILQKYRCSDDMLVGTVNLGPNNDWNTVIISNNGQRAYCVAWAPNGHIASVDLDQMKLIRNYGGFQSPHGIALNPNNDTIYVTAQTGNFIMKLDTSFNSYTEISLDGSPINYSSSLDAHEIILAPNNQDIYISCQKTNEIRVFNIPSNSVSNVISTGVYPQEMAISLTKNKLFVSCPEDQISYPGYYGTVSVINLTTKSEDQRIQVGFMPHGICVDDSRNLVYVASRNLLTSGPAPHHTAVCNGRNGFVSYINLNSLLVLPKRTEVSVDPYSASFRK
jgi:DNA-binding beta-propeller fold protein YncE